MSVQTLEKKEQAADVKIPDYLVYEVVKGEPIYYKGYRDVLNKTKTFEEIRMESRIQSWLKAHIAAFFINLFDAKKYTIASGELGLNMHNDSKRGADIAIFKTENWVLDEHFSNLPPEAIFEIDVQADCENMATLDYVLEKIQDYLDFGVKEVYWVFTKNKKIMVAKSNQPWLTHNWDADLHVLGEAQLNVAKLVPAEEKKK